MTFPFKLVSAATTNATLVAARRARIVGGQLVNTSTGLRYVKVFNLARAPVPGTDPATQVWGLPAGAAVPVSDLVGPKGLLCGVGLALAITGGASDADSTSVTAGDVVLSLLVE